MYYFDFGSTDNLEKTTIKKTFTTDNSVVLTMEIFYNNITGYLYMDVYNEDDEQVAMGIKLVQRVNLFAKFSYLLPIDIVAYILPVTDTYEFAEVTIDNFNSGVRMYYYESV